MDKPKMDKFLWVMFWWAIWDAFWAPVEFIAEWCFEPVDTKEWKIWLMKFWKDFWDRTDDTAMALLLADSLVRSWWSDVVDQLENYLKRKESWHMWLKDYPEWIGKQVRIMLDRYIDYKNHWWEEPRTKDLSWQMMDWNWSLMRIWPVPLYFYDNAKEALKWASESSITTHNSDLCIDSCIYYTWLIWWAIHGVSKEELMKWFYYPAKWYWEFRDISNDFWRIVNWDFKKKESNQIIPSWYVIDSLETALWWFYHSTCFEDWLKMVVDKWWDADTTACIYWYLAWGYYWYDSIPDYLKQWVSAKDFIRHTAEELYNHEYKEYDLSKVKSVIPWDHETRTWTNVLED